MRFQPGQSGNPAGRPRGSRNRRTIAAERLFGDRTGKLTKMLIDLAKRRHPVALQMCMEEVLPLNDRSVSFDLPRMETASDAFGAIRSIAQGLAEGDVTPREAVQLAERVRSFTRSLSGGGRRRALREPVKGQKSG